LVFGSITKVSAVVTLCWLLNGCGPGGSSTAKPIGQAFVGPAQLKIRNDIPLQSSTVTTVKHGDRLEILQTRRKFLRVRTPDGKEGWTDERSLLAAADMQALRDLAQHSSKLPNQGVAITYQPLNIHTQPAMSSPSFVQLKENDKVEVLQSVLLPRTDVPRTPLIPPMPKKTKAPPKKERKGRVPLPPAPKPPEPPADWVELSRHADEADEAATAPETPPVKVDGWSLVRMPGGQVGWVLTRLVSMAIPDEVAQYAEGHRIVSYFALGETPEGDQKKKIWLWTTTTDSRAAWDFDSFRVFVWSLKRHRYETSYIERNIKGYAPVLIKDVDYGGKGLAGRYPGFSICMDKKDGTRARRFFALIGQTIRLAGERLCEPPPPPMTVPAPAPLSTVGALPSAQPPKEGFFERLRKRFKK
jgi:hypothetical protein